MVAYTLYEFCDGWHGILSPRSVWAVLPGSAVYFRKALVVKQHSAWYILLSTTSHYCHCHPLRAFLPLLSPHTRVKSRTASDPQSVCSHGVTGDDLTPATGHFLMSMLVMGGTNLGVAVSPLTRGIAHLGPFFKPVFAQALVISEICPGGFRCRTVNPTFLVWSEYLCFSEAEKGCVRV